MRKFTFCCTALLVLSAVFMFSGCGGGSLPPEEENETSTATTQQTIAQQTDTPSTFTASEVFPGTWIAANEVGSKSIIALNGISMMLVNSEIGFQNVNINGDYGTSALTGGQLWRAVSSDRDDYYISFDLAPVEMVRYGGDTWHCMISADRPAQMDITIQSGAMIGVIYEDYYRISNSLRPVRFQTTEIIYRKK